MQREYPSANVGGDASRHTPWDPIQALMESAPGDEPAVSKLELLALREAIADAIDSLGEREKWIVNALMVERLSLRCVARQLGMSKTFVAWLRDKAIGELRLSLSKSPAVQAHLHGTKEPGTP
jgi:DNA-directed RNA polymerase specialized sigma24 family protein